MYCSKCKREVNELIVEGDVSADPIWCKSCSINFDIDEFRIPRRLKSELMEWIHQYGKWIDWSKDEFMLGGLEMEKQFNLRGAALTEQLIKEIGDKYKIEFSPATTSELYYKE